MSSFLILLLLSIVGLKVFAIMSISDVKKSFLIASSAEFLYLGIGVLSSYAIGASILHIEYQIAFRGLAILMLMGFFKYAKSTSLEDSKGVGWGISGVIFGFAIFGSLGVSLVTSKQLMLNAIINSQFPALGYILIVTSILQAYYLITLFENIVMKNGVEPVKKIDNILPVSAFFVAGVLVFVYPSIYLIIPSVFYKLPIYHLSVNFDFAGINGLFAGLFAFIMFMVFMYSFEYIKTNKKFYYTALSVLTLALIEVVVSYNFENFYLFWELMTISSYLLIMQTREDASISAAKLYFLMCIAGAYILQFVFAHFFVQGLNSFADVNTISITLAILLFIGFGVKAGIVPIHSWLPVAHPEAPSSISAPLSGVLTKAGIFGIIAIIYKFGFHSEIFSYLLIAVGLVTLVYGETKTLFEKDVKRFLAYSTIGQIGEIVTVLGLGTALALSGALFHIINHAIVKDLLFLSAGLLILSAGGSRNLEALQGIGKKMPLLAIPFGMGIFAISAFPPFGNFNSKFLMIIASVNSHNYIVAFGLIMGAIIGFIAMMRLFKVVFLLDPVEGASFAKVGGLKLVVVYGLAVVSLLLGLFGDNVIQFINAAIDTSLNLNVSFSFFNLFIPMSVATMFIGAAVVFLFAKNSKQAGVVAAITSFVSFVMLLKNYSSFEYNVMFALLVAFMAILNFLYAAKYMDHSHKANRFFANFMVMVAGILGVSLSKDIYSLFFYWEIMGGWALYIALAHEEDELSVRDATKYLIYNFAGAGILMIGFSIVLQYGFDLSVFKGLELNNTTILAVSLLTIGFLAKAAQLPIRIDYQMHPKPAPTPISGYISSVMLKTGPFMMTKMFYFFMAGSIAVKILPIEIISHIAAIIGAVTILMGAGFGLLTNSMKRLLIFLTVAEIGYIITGASLLTSAGFAGGMLHFANHMFFKDLLFLSAGAIFYKTGIDNLDEIGGLARKMPITFITFLVAVFSTAGVPLYSGFVSKWIIYHALLAKGYVFLAIMTLLGSIMILLVFVKFLHSAYFGKLDKQFRNVEKVDWYMAVPMGILAVFNIVLGIFPSIMIYPVNIALHEFGFEPIKYALTSVTIGHDTLNMGSLSVYLIVAIVIGAFAISYFSNHKERNTHIFLSGVRDLSDKEIHLHSQNYYEPLIHLIASIIKTTKRIFGLKGGYIER